MNNLFKYLFFALVLFYAIVLSQFGFENWDTGYFTSFSWRILNGQNPYSGFIYKGPPVTLYWHAFWLQILPENGQYFFTRVVNYLLFALQVFFTVSAFDKWFDFKKLNLNKWAIMCLGFSVSLLNFPAFAWNTIDGLLFASAALYLMSLKNNSSLNLAAIALLCILSALTKQSFYFIPLLFLAWIYIENRLKSALLYLGFCMVYLLLYGFFINHIAGFGTYFQLTTGETTLSGLFYVGVIEYYNFFHNSIISISILFIALLISWFIKKNQSLLYTFFKILPLILVAASVILCFMNNIRIASKVAFVALALLIVTKYIFDKVALRKLAPVIVALGIAWCSSISFGYSYPIFYATGIIAGILALSYNDLRAILPQKALLAAGVAIFAVAFASNYRLYREKPLHELQFSMEEVSPKLMFVKTSKDNLEKHLELKKLVAEFGPNFIVAPSIPMANYLFNEQSNLPADWIINTEVDRQYDFFVTLASDKNNFIFLEKSYLTGEEMSLADKRETSEISWQIYSTFNKIGETQHFIIYNGLR